jgi:hypothetical protein
MGRKYGFTIHDLGTRCRMSGLVHAPAGLPPFPLNISLGMDTVEQGTISCPYGNRTRVVQPVARRYAA